MTDDRHCKDILQSLSDYIDGYLQKELCDKIEKHLSGCENCRVVVNTIRKTVELYHDPGVEGEKMPEDVRNRLYLRLNIADFLKKS